MNSLTLFLSLCIVSAISHATPIPLPNHSFKLNQTKPQMSHSDLVLIVQNAGSSCTYSVTIKTSCTSPSYTRDRISLAFGDAYGYQVYVPRLDDPRSGTFERCSTDTFEIYGPCTYQICYLYLYRTGYDGWLPEKVTVYGYNSKPVTFYYNTYIPNGIWYGFDYCRVSDGPSGLSFHTKNTSKISGGPTVMLPLCSCGPSVHKANYGYAMIFVAAGVAVFFFSLSTKL
ncbi:Embryo-specific protein ATS3B, partial [Mucuna pruriens]